MPNAIEHFFWGATVSAHAVEGRDFASDWWRFEQRPGRIAAGGTSELASDHLSRYKEDLKLARKAGLNTLVYGLSWARIEPQRGQVDEDALAHYADVFAEMHQNGITPVAVLVQDALPAWFSDQGAWEGSGAEGSFRAFLERVHGAIGAHCRYWIPFWDPVLWHRMVFGEGRWPRPARTRQLLRLGVSGLAHFHRCAMEFLREQHADNRIGISIAAPALRPADPHSPWDERAARWQRQLHDQFLTDTCPSDSDRDGLFVALSLPGRQYIHFAPHRLHGLMAQYEDSPGRPGSADTGAPDPGALPGVLDRVHQWGLPVLIVGGLASDDDRERCRYVLDHVSATLAARERGMGVVGYCHRSLLDGFEGRNGFTRRYGLIHVDRKTLARTPNPSAFLMQELAKSNGIRPGAVARFCPTWHSPLQEAG